MSQPKVTVINCTARYGGIDILLHSLKRQTFQDFDVLIVDEKYDERHEEIMDYFEREWPGSYGGKIKHIKPLPKKDGMFWNLSRSLNQALTLSSGEIIIFVQDYLWLAEDSFQRFVDKFDEMGDCLISGVGHKGNTPDWAVDLKGKISIFTDYVNEERALISDRDKHWAYDKPEGIWHKDPRVRGLGFNVSHPIEWEGNYAAVTRKICFEIGGFDEDFDAGWGYDNVNFAERAVAAGYEVWLDEDNIHKGFSHELLFQEEDFKHDAPNNVHIWAQKCEDIQRGRVSYRVSDLEEMRLRMKLGDPSLVGGK